MTKKELQLVLKVLNNIKNPDTYVIEAKHNVEKDIVRYERMRGQLMDNYEVPW